MVSIPFTTNGVIPYFKFTIIVLKFLLIKLSKVKLQSKWCNTNRSYELLPCEKILITFNNLLEFMTKHFNKADQYICDKLLKNCFLISSSNTKF